MEFQCLIIIKAVKLQREHILCMALHQRCLGCARCKPRKVLKFSPWGIMSNSHFSARKNTTYLYRAAGDLNSPHAAFQIHLPPAPFNKSLSSSSNDIVSCAREWLYISQEREFNLWYDVRRAKIKTWWAIVDPLLYQSHGKLCDKSCTIFFYILIWPSRMAALGPKAFYSLACIHRLFQKVWCQKGLHHYDASTGYGIVLNSIKLWVFAVFFNTRLQNYSSI